MSVTGRGSRVAMCKELLVLFPKGKVGLSRSDTKATSG